MTIGLDSTAISLRDDPPFFENLQGNILQPHGKSFVAHLLLTFDAANVQGALAFIADVTAGFVTSAANQILGDKDHYGGLYLSASGYAKLGLLDAAPFDNAFRQGMKVRGPLVYGDPQPTSWDADYQASLDALVLVAADSQDVLNNLVAEITASLSRNKAGTFTRQDGAVLRNGQGLPIENFGFRDGISQPLVMKSEIDSEGPIDQWDPGATVGQLVLDDPGPGGAFGSYVVYRKLEQDVTKFDGLVGQLAGKLDIEKGLAGAYAMGRFQDGTPVLLQGTPGGAATNNFNYSTDPTASKCPFQSHARKTNPRGDTTTLPNAGTIPFGQERSHRISRRQSGYTDPGAKVGLHWMCFGGKIVEQFEFIQSAWSNTNNFVEQQVGLDAIIGQGTQIPTEGQSFPAKWGGTSFQRFDLSNCVYMRGGELFFAPSIPTLKRISQP